MKNVFITGGTGFVGGYLIKRLLDDKDVRPIILARGKKGESASDRVASTLKYFYNKGELATVLKRIKVVEGEISQKDLGIDPNTLSTMTEEIDEIYHSAAIAEFRVPLDKIRKSNVEGAENVFKLAMKCKDAGRLKKLHHISTTFVAGTKTGTFSQDQLNVNQAFHNTYEQSKFEAELLAHEYMKKGLDITIFRPSILTGDYASGRTSNFKMLYQPLHFFAAELFDVVPGNDNTEVNLIPADTVADAIYDIANRDGISGKTFHICNPATVRIGHFLDLASDFFGFHRPRLIPLEKFDAKNLTFVQKSLIGPYEPYFNYKLLFECRENFKCPVITDEFMIKLFKYCDKTGFIKRKKQYVSAG